LAGSNFGRERVAGVEAVEETVDLSTDFAWYACVTHIHPRVVRPGVHIGSEEMISSPPMLLCENPLMIWELPSATKPRNSLLRYLLCLLLLRPPHDLNFFFLFLFTFSTFVIASLDWGGEWRYDFSFIYVFAGGTKGMRDGR